MSFRRWTEADRDTCLALFDSNVPRYFRAEERAAYEAWLSEPGGPVVVGSVDGAVVAAGGAALEADGTTGSLCWGIVDAAWHRRGLGRALLLERLALLAAMPACRRVRLSTIGSTEGFFLRLGFKTVRVDPEGHGDGVDAYEMEADLSDELRRALLARALPPARPAPPPAP